MNEDTVLSNSFSYRNNYFWLYFSIKWLVL